jgi:prophage regulatory protein
MSSDNRLLRLPEVIAKTSFGRASIYRYVALKRFPQPVKLGERGIAWRSDEIDAWIDERARVSDTPSKHIWAKTAQGDV